MLSAEGWLEARAEVTTRSFGARFEPTFGAQHFEMPANRGLRQLQNGGELVNGELAAFECEQDAAPRRIGEGGHLTEECRAAHSIHPFIRIKGYTALCRQSRTFQGVCPLRYARRYFIVLYALASPRTAI